jgi:hypothetical protein
MHNNLKEQLEEFKPAARGKRLAMFVDNLIEDEKTWAKRLDRFAAQKADQDGGRTWLQYLPEEDLESKNKMFKENMTPRDVATAVAANYDRITALCNKLLKTGQLTPLMRETIQDLVDQHDRQKADFFVRADQIAKI